MAGDDSIPANERHVDGELFSVDDIMSVAQPFEPLCGVYFLIDGDEIVYVGQSVNVAA